MKTHQTLFASLMPLESFAVLAAEPADSDVVSHTEGNNEVREARADGLPSPAGEAESCTFARGPLTWDRSPAEFKEDVLEAHRHGELIPEGEGQPLAVGTAAAGAQSFRRLVGSWRKQRGAQ